MQTKQLIKFGAIGVAIFFLTKNVLGDVFNKISYGMPKLKVNNLSLTGLRAQLYLSISNKTQVDIPIQGFTGRLLYGSYPLANIVLGEAMTIRGNDTSTLVSQVNVNFLDLGQNIVQLVQSGEFLHGLRLKGTLRAFDFNVPINTPINIV